MDWLFSAGLALHPWDNLLGIFSFTICYWTLFAIILLRDFFNNKRRKGYSGYGHLPEPWEKHDCSQFLAAWALSRPGPTGWPHCVTVPTWLGHMEEETQRKNTRMKKARPFFWGHSILKKTNKQKGLRPCVVLGRGLSQGTHAGCQVRSIEKNK